MPECDIDGNDRDVPLDQPWLSLAIPSSNGKLNNCVRYAPIIMNGSSTSPIGKNQCNSDMFNTSLTIPCTENVYASDEMNVQTEVRTIPTKTTSDSISDLGIFKIVMQFFQFNIHCSDAYKLALIGSVDNLARFMSLPLVGLLSDRFEFNGKKYYYRVIAYCLLDSA